MLRKNLSILSLLLLTFVSVSIFAMMPKTKKPITINGINSVPFSRYLQCYRMFPGLVPTLPFQKRGYAQNQKKRNFMNDQCSYKKTIAKVGRVGLFVGGYFVVVFGSIAVLGTIAQDIWFHRKLSFQRQEFHRRERDREIEIEIKRILEG